MNAFYWQLAGDFRVIIHDERRGRSRDSFVQSHGVSRKFVQRFAFSAQLNHVDAALNHLLGDVSNIGLFDVA
jgi:hypothetical protein